MLIKNKSQKFIQGHTSLLHLYGILSMCKVLFVKKRFSWHLIKCHSTKIDIPEIHTFLRYIYTNFARSLHFFRENLYQFMKCKNFDNPELILLE